MTFHQVFKLKRSFYTRQEKLKFDILLPFGMKVLFFRNYYESRTRDVFQYILVKLAVSAVHNYT